MQQKIADERRNLTVEQRNMAVAAAQDSSAMKSIALLTMIFLPTNAIAVSDSSCIPKAFYVQELTPRLQDDIQHHSLFLSCTRRLVACCILTILNLLGRFRYPLTIIVVALWALWTHRADVLTYLFGHGVKQHTGNLETGGQLDSQQMKSVSTEKQGYRVANNHP